ncbi:hypothetical protein SBV1_770009 [Verrucomicrobia bacterium]|nr:hypothetical protein SBV1_770009 [Verrucomicrobiota bacterium]
MLLLNLDQLLPPFPPGKAVTVGAYSGNVQVTMQISTDLANWTSAVNGAVYTNSPDATSPMPALRFSHNRADC